MFIASKSYYDLETTLSLPGVAAFYASVNFIGFFVCFVLLPETERRTLEDIELHFSDNTRSLRDRKIAKNVAGKCLQPSSTGDHNKARLSTISEKTPSAVVTMVLNNPAKAETGRMTGIYNKSYSGDS